MPDCKDLGWFQSCEMGHLGYYEYLIYWDQREDTDGMDQFYVESAKMNIENGCYPALLRLPPAAVSDRTGLRSQLSPVDSRSERDLRSPVDLSSASSTGSRRIREEGGLMQEVKTWETPEGIPLSGQPESENELIFSIYTTSAEGGRINLPPSASCVQLPEECFKRSCPAKV